MFQVCSDLFQNRSNDMRRQVAAQTLVADEQWPLQSRAVSSLAGVLRVAMIETQIEQRLKCITVFVLSHFTV